MNKNVLFITRKWPPAVGGMETYCVELVAALKTQINLSVEALPGRENGAPPTALALIGFGLRSLVGLASARPKYDVIHAADMAIWPLALAASMRAPGAKVVLSAHGTDVAFANRRGMLPRLYRFYVRLGARLLRNSTVLANSRATATLLERHGFEHREIIPLAAKAAPASAQPPQPYLLFVGRLTKQKGCRWFIENVLPNLPERLSLRVVGPIIDASEKTALAAPRVAYHGPARGEELAQLRREALAVVVPNIDSDPTYFEGFGLAATEASAAGGVALAANVFGLKDAVIDGRTGYLLPASEPEAWVQKITAIADWTQEEREQFITHSVNETAEFFSWSRVARDTLAAYA
jgi:glycosyltransferase involved in cell wall biosynthesis